MAIVHLVRHGQVDNPTGVLYARLPGFHLSDIGRAMAERLAQHFAEVPLTHLRCSPLERAQETMAPIAAQRPDLAVVLDDRLLESTNVLAGKVFSVSSSVLRDPRTWWHLRNPLRPSWGEPYREVVARMNAAVLAAAEAAGPLGQACVISHQMPIWVTRRTAEGRSLIHDPRTRECALGSVTSLTVTDGHIVRVSYAEPCQDLVPPKKSRRFVAGA